MLRTASELPVETATEPVVDSELAAGAEGRKAAVVASALLGPEEHKETVPASSTADLEPLESNAVSAVGLGPRAVTATAVSAADLEPRPVAAAGLGPRAVSAATADGLEPRAVSAVAVAGICDGPKAASICDGPKAASICEGLM